MIMTANQLRNVIAMLALTAILAACAVLACTPDTRDARPNVVMIISDDQGHSDYGFMGSQHVLTPTIDRLAAEGTVFPNGYVTSSICAPSASRRPSAVIGRTGCTRVP